MGSRGRVSRLVGPGASSLPGARTRRVICGHRGLGAAAWLGGAGVALAAFSWLACLAPSVTAYPLSGHAPPTTRAYELVSPPDKNGGGALSGASAYGFPAGSGEAFQFNTASLFGDPSGVQFAFTAPYVSRRSPVGWVTKAATPPICRVDLDDTYGVPVVPDNLLFSPDLGRLVFTHPESQSCAIPPLDPVAPLPQANLYLTELDAEARRYTLIAPAPAPIYKTFAMPSGIPSGFSADLQHVVYSSSGQQTPDAPVKVEGAGMAVFSVFEWDDRAKEVRLVSKDEDDDPIKLGASTPGAGSAAQNPVSADGSRIFFESLGGVWMREHALSSHLVSAAECTSECAPAGPSIFQGASPNGQAALIIGAAKLTDDDRAGSDLFLYRHSAEPPVDSNLRRISTDGEPSDGVSSGYQGTVAMSEDLGVVYFVASSQLVAGESTVGGPKLYRWRSDGEIRYLATLDTGDEAVWTSGAGDPYKLSRQSHSTPDGQYLVLRVLTRLDPAADQDSTADFYRWDQVAGWTCVSCQGLGVASSGSADGALSNPSENRQITDDGGRVFFTTPESLVAADVNAPTRDLYEWHNGATSLISTGTGSSDIRLLGFSRSGDDVFFYTEQRLVGWDGDSAGDIYDARIGGGFPEPLPPPEPCEAGACREGIPMTPTFAKAATEDPGRPGNVRSRRCRKKSKKPTAKSRKICAKRRRTRRDPPRASKPQSGASQRHETRAGHRG